MYVLLISVLSISIFLFSYLWIDYGLLLMVSEAHPYLNFLFSIISYGNNHREQFSLIYIFLIFLLFAFGVLLLRHKFLEKLSTSLLFYFAAITTLVFTLSYNFLSYDTFTYLFFSKTYFLYHIDPYTFAPKDFASSDLWVSFMRTIDTSYRYGYVSLFYSLIPIAVLSAKRFILVYFGLKIMNGIIFYLAGLMLYKMMPDKKYIFPLWFFNPLLIIELLVNGHNDLVMIFFFILSMFLITKRRWIISFLAFLASIFTKNIDIYIIPAFFLLINSHIRRMVLRLAFFGFLIFLQLLPSAVHAWYYTWLYMFLPFVKLKITTWFLLSVINLVLLIHYYSYIGTGYWGASLITPYEKPTIVFLIGLMVSYEYGVLRKLCVLVESKINLSKHPKLSNLLRYLIVR